MKGIAASSGIAIGTVHILKKSVLNTQKRLVSDINEELQRLEKNKTIAMSQLDSLYEKTAKKLSKEEAQVFEAHKLMLLDETLMGDIRKLMKSETCCAEYAVDSVMNKTIQLFKNIDDDYMRERAQDIEDVKIRLIGLLNDVEENGGITGENVVLFAEDLTPSDTVSIDKNQILAFVTEKGGNNSHSSIMARMLGIPAIVGVGDEYGSVTEGDVVIVDGSEGQIYFNPSSEMLTQYEQIQIKQQRENDALLQYVNTPAVTNDGHSVQICGNIASEKDLDAVLEVGCDGVGLFRTEFLFMDRSSAPCEKEQFHIYKQVAERLGNKPLTIRTLDIGGDKNVDYLGVKDEENPFLGCRAIRLCFQQEAIFRTQLRAILRASAFGNISIMFPMISGIDECRKARKLVDSVKKELKEESIDYDNGISIGIMIEIPSAAIMSDILAKEVDFFSIGTNDLIQYSLAVDRMNTSVESLYTPYDPAVLRLTKLIVENGHAAGIEVSMCGEAASDEELIPTLIGLGLDKLSMSTSFVLKSKKLIKSISYKQSKRLSDNTLNCSTSNEVKEIIRTNNI